MRSLIFGVLVLGAIATPCAAKPVPRTDIDDFSALVQLRGQTQVHTETKEVDAMAKFRRLANWVMGLELRFLCLANMYLGKATMGLWPLYPASIICDYDELSDK